MNDTGGEKSYVNRESNPGSLAHRANILITELSRHTEQTINLEMNNDILCQKILLLDWICQR